MLLKGFWKILTPLRDNGTFRCFLFVIAAKPLNQQILAFFSILLVSRLRLTCSVCDGTLETSYWKCRQWVLRVCKLVNIQNFIFHGHFGAKNHCCTVYTGISRFSIFDGRWCFLQNRERLADCTTWKSIVLAFICAKIDRFSSKIEVFSLFWNLWWQKLEKCVFSIQNEKKCDFGAISGHEGGLGSC